MEKVVTVNLGGNAYQLDESAFEVLRAYLDLANRQLADNPDRPEILADFEQAIADKCRRFLNVAKTVVTAAEMRRIVDEMGPVDGAEPPPAQGAPAGGSARSESAAPTPRKRFYRIREGAMMGGVCTGLAAYFDVDVTIVRVVVVVLSVMGWGILVYWLLVFIVPEAQTPEEQAAAHGAAPFNAQAIVDEAKRATAQAAQHARSTVDELRSPRAAWRRQWRAQRRQWRRMPPPTWFGVLPLLLVIGVVWFVLTMVWPLVPPGVPTWARVLAVVVLMQIVTSPLRAMRVGPYGMQPYAWLAVWDGLIGVGVMGLAIWLLYTHMAPPHDLGGFISGVPGAVRSLANEMVHWF